MREHHLRRIRLYENDGVLSAIFRNRDSLYVEVRVWEQQGWVWESASTTYDPLYDRITCRGGSMIGESSFADEQAGRNFFWQFVADPDTGYMECQL